jgi:putative FmdB family regulatory protein
MPTYVYNCKTCGEYEIHQSFQDNTLTVCPKCGGKEIKKVLSASVGFVFKGSGFYQNDYKNKPEPKCEGCDKAKGCPHAEKN